MQEYYKRFNKHQNGMSLQMRYLTYYSHSLSSSNYLFLRWNVSKIKKGENIDRILQNVSAKSIEIILRLDRLLKFFLKYFGLE